MVAGKEEKIGDGPIKWGDGCHVVHLEKRTERAVCRGLFPVPRGGCDRKAENACV